MKDKLVILLNMQMNSLFRKIEELNKSSKDIEETVEENK